MSHHFRVDSDLRKEGLRHTKTKEKFRLDNRADASSALLHVCQNVPPRPSIMATRHRHSIAPHEEHMPKDASLPLLLFVALRYLNLSFPLSLLLASFFLQVLLILYILVSTFNNWSSIKNTTCQQAALDWIGYTMA